MPGSCLPPHPIWTTALLALTVPLPATLAAQSTQNVPANADVAEGHGAAELPFGVAGFRTQILAEGAAVGANGAVLSGIRFRSDRSSLPLAGGAVPNVTVALSHTNLAPGQLSTTFASNGNGPTTVVFQGTVVLPGHRTGGATPLPWDVAIQFSTPFAFTTAQGHLLIDITANNAPGGTPTHWLDAGQAGGSVATFGEAGTNPSSDSLNLLASTGNQLNPLQIVPGGSVDLTSTLSFTNPPGVLMLGAAALPVPLDLGPFGAPTHSVYLAPVAYVGHAWTQSFIGWFSTVSVNVPNSPGFVDQVFYAQSVLFDATANAAGLLTSHALQVRIGDNQSVFPLQQLDAMDPAAATGTLLDFNPGGPAPQFGAALIQLDGVFF